MVKKLDNNYIYPGNHFYDTIVSASAIFEDTLRTQKSIRITSASRLKTVIPYSETKLNMYTSPDSRISGSRHSPSTCKEISSQLVLIERENKKDMKDMKDIDVKNKNVYDDCANLDDRTVI